MCRRLVNQIRKNSVEKTLTKYLKYLQTAKNFKSDAQKSLSYITCWW